LSTYSSIILSVITVCRNGVERLRITIDSLRSFYNDPRFEHIVIDGGSTDATFELVAPLNSYSNFRFVSGIDAGIYDGMNRGTIESRAPILLFLNCGDSVIASPDEVFAAIKKLVKPDSSAVFDICCFSVLQVGPLSSRISCARHSSLHKMPTSHQGMFFSRQFVLRKKYEVGYKIAGDYDLYLRADKIGYSWECGAKVLPLVSVELEEKKKKNPLKSYYEYIIIASQRLSGWNRVLVIARIIARATVVVSLKYLIPNRYIFLIRGV
jgi:putative colanic acid biosynthesis glycosyltransferase